MDPERFEETCAYTLVKKPLALITTQLGAHLAPSSKSFALAIGKLSS